MNKLATCTLAALLLAPLTGLMQHHIDTGRSTPGMAQKNGVAVSLTGKRNEGRAEPE